MLRNFHPVFREVRKTAIGGKGRGGAEEGRDGRGEVTRGGDKRGEERRLVVAIFKID